MVVCQIDSEILSASYTVAPGTLHTSSQTAVLQDGDTRYFPTEGQVRVGDALLILPSTPTFRSTTPLRGDDVSAGTPRQQLGHGTSAPQDQVARLLESTMQGTLKSKRSLGKARATVADVSEGSRLWILSRDPATAGKRVILDVLFAQALSREEGGENIQVAFPEVVGVLKNVGK